MTTHVLVACATKAGSTVEVATAIGQVLTERGYQVSVQPIGEKPLLAGYAAAVLGSAIRMGAWLPEAVEFVRANQAALSRMPVAIFTVHFLNTGDDEASRTARQAYTAPVHKLLTPQAEAFFSGKMDYSKLSFIDRTIARAVERSTHTRPGDLRDWTAIRSWARGILS
jgi:menaquinone-dependent protoporphyrinogen oxidase